MCVYTFLSDSGEGIVNDCGPHSVGLDVVVLVVQSEVDKLLLCSAYQHIAPVHVPVLKLQTLCTQWSEGEEEDNEERRGKGGKVEGAKMEI